jgi:hypothetical protein
LFPPGPGRFARWLQTDIVSRILPSRPDQHDNAPSRGQRKGRFSIKSKSLHQSSIFQLFSFCGWPAGRSVEREGGKQSQIFDRQTLFSSIEICLPSSRRKTYTRRMEGGREGGRREGGREEGGRHTTGRKNIDILDTRCN